MPPLKTCPLDRKNPFFPFHDRISFDWAKHHFVEMQSSAPDINTGLDVWLAAVVNASQDPNATIPWSSARELYATIDKIQHGSAPFVSIPFKYAGPLPDDPPTWMTEEYNLSVHDTQQVIRDQLASPEFALQFDPRPYRQFNNDGERIWSNLLSGDWAWEEADKIMAENPANKGSMLVPIVSGLDKTTVSVATGHQEYHPFYISVGNLTNEARRGHGNGIIPVAFLPIPHVPKNQKTTLQYKSFVRQMYHACITRIFEPLRAGMTTPEILQCPDGHLRHSVYSIGPVIADYPEQVWLATIVQGWCPKCLSKPKALDKPAGTLRTREGDELLVQRFDPGTLWKGFGLCTDVAPFTEHFPRADIHLLMAPDLLHQVIKGTFKDHLVEWVMDYIKVTYKPESLALAIIADIDRRISAVPIYPGLRRFKDGRDFAQWTGDDSKALMKVYIGSIKGYVPDEMVQCLSAFMNACYIFRRNAITTTALELASLELDKFHALRHVFIQTDTRTHVALPRQHALQHLRRSTKLFGSPNGLCSSMTEARHISAVKEPWRRSNRFNALPQMLRTIDRLEKFSALEHLLRKHGYLAGSTSHYTAQTLFQPANQGHHSPNDEDFDFTQQPQLFDAEPVAGPHTLSTIAMATEYSKSFELVTESFLRYLFLSRHPTRSVPSDVNEAVRFTGKIRVHFSATASFYAPSDVCGIGGMQRQVIRCHPRWKAHPRKDIVLIRQEDSPTLSGMRIAQILLLFSFTDMTNNIIHHCAFVEWFEVVGEHVDADTGMWVVRREGSANARYVSVIQLEMILWGAHLLPVYGTGRLPEEFSFTEALDSFDEYLVNSFVDHHMHELLYD
ncbi:hypothetical protein FA15DRAFT_683552 [Coprinopsis marcescibilis]|uniref:Uncharacterized protein n=1 Tax=Coprinopsis marcescibilis TaxID=230819 RepID=A0A5C3KBB9_COPMA|nr:hypothetical protein FA15DRAFT_683552 [Coprinopsis marcescibilis]